jgi:hypothetical protein
MSTTRSSATPQAELETLLLPAVGTAAAALRARLD